MKDSTREGSSLRSVKVAGAAGEGFSFLFFIAEGALKVVVLSEVKDSSLRRSSFDGGQDLGRRISGGHAEFVGAGVDLLDLTLCEVGLGRMAVWLGGSKSRVTKGADATRTLIFRTDTSPGLSI